MQIYKGKLNAYLTKVKDVVNKKKELSNQELNEFRSKILQIKEKMDILVGNLFKIHTQNEE